MPCFKSSPSFTIPKTPAPPAFDDLSLNDWRTHQEKVMAGFGQAYRDGRHRTYQDHKFDGLAGMRANIQKALVAAEASEKQLFAFEHCSDSVYIYRGNDTGELRFNINACHSRWCPKCAKARSGKAVRDVLCALPKFLNNPLFLTFTQRKDPDESISAAIKRIRVSFSKLRNTPLWKRSVIAGIYVIEITMKDQGEFHAHIHAVVDSGYIGYEALHAAWSKVCGYPARMQIDPAKDPKQIAHYLAKYLAKPMPDAFFHNAPLLTQIMIGLKHTRLLSTFGEWLGISVSSAAKEARKQRVSKIKFQNWTYVCTIHDALRNCRDNRPGAVDFLVKLGFGPPPDFPTASWHYVKPSYQFPKPQPPPLWRNPSCPISQTG